MMEMQSLVRGVAVVCLCVFAGCSTVTSVNPVGRSPATGLSDELTGTWMGSEGHQLQIHCNTEGVLTFAVTEWKEDQGQFVLETGEGRLKMIGDLVIFNYLENDENETSPYSFLLIRAQDGQLVAWLPDVEAFRALVEEQVLAGNVDEGPHSASVMLTGLSEEIAKVLEDFDCAKLFDWSEPAVVLVRIGGKG
jgi:hypothetical protein